MKTNLKIEAIGYHDNETVKFYGKMVDSAGKGLGRMFHVKPRYWVAEIIGNHPVYKLDRMFLKYKVDYLSMNSRSSRGVYVNYILETNKVYEVSSPVSWKKTERYFAVVDNDGNIVKYERYKDAKASIR